MATVDGIRFLTVKMGTVASKSKKIPHSILEAEVPPEKVMNDFKVYASRALNRLKGEEGCRRRWVRHGSTRWLWKDQDVREAIRYVVEEQGKPMAIFLGDVP